MDLPATASDRPDDWTRSLVACLGALVIGAVLLFAVMVAVDPYDSGKFGWLGIEGVDDRDPHTASASRVRDAQFDSAIIGNSTAQILNPAELSQATGLRFVQLYLTSGLPPQQLAVAGAFLRHHPKPGALVIVTDPLWCVYRRFNAADERFPYWLYDDGWLAYAARLLSWPAIEHASQRISIGLGWRKRREANGYYNYEDIWLPGVFRPVKPPWDVLPGAPIGGRDGFPEIEQLDAFVKRLPSDVPVVLVVPPAFHTTVAKPGTPAAAARQACSTALKQVVAGRPHSNFINYRLDNAMTRDPDNFADLVHYRPSLGRKVMEGITDSIRLGEAARIDF
jgi:hypothetical protein